MVSDNSLEKLKLLFIKRNIYSLGMVEENAEILADEFVNNICSGPLASIVKIVIDDYISDLMIDDDQINEITSPK